MSFRLFGARITVSYFLILSVTAALILDRENRFLSCFFAAFLHESGHLLLMHREGVPPKSIRLGLFDIKIVSEPPKTDGALARILLSGPLMNLLSSLIFVPFSRTLYLSNLALGVFNLLPIESLDGGELLKLILKRRLSETATARVMHALAFFFLFPLFFCGIILLFQTTYNLSLLLVSLYLFAVLMTKR